MTSGGTYGPQWQVGADDTAAPLLDIGGADGSSGGPGFDIPPPELIPDDDPVDWTYDAAEDTYYRSPTTLEMADNPWLSATDLLVIPPRLILQELSDGDGSMDLPIPMLDEFGGRPQDGLPFRDLRLGKVGTTDNVPFMEQRWEDNCLRRSTLRVSFSFYESRGFDPLNIDVNDVEGSAISTGTRNSLAVLGATEDQSFSLRGPYLPARVPLELALPTEKSTFYVLTTRFDPNPGVILTGSGGTAPFSLDDKASDLVSPTHPSSSHADLFHLCFDGVQNGHETAPDCGGPDCPPCGVGQACVQASDCISRLCFHDKGNIPGICSSQCSDGLDNDPDGFADTCDFSCVEHPDFSTDTVVHSVPLEHAKPVGVFGTMEFCTINEAPYLASFIQWSTTATRILNNIIPDSDPPGYDPAVRPPPFAVTMRGCIIAETSDIARSCDAAPGIEPTPCPNELSDYPLRDISTNSWTHVDDAGVNAHAWELADFIIEGGTVSDTSPVQMVAIANLGTGANAEGELGNGLSVRVNVGWEAPGYAGSASFNGTTDRAGHTLAHELGHLVGLAHDDAVYPGTTIPGIMQADGVGLYPTINWDSDSNLGGTQGAAWQNTSKTTPRASGFLYTGCATDADCSTEHPNLVCSSYGPTTNLYCIPASP